MNKLTTILLLILILVSCQKNIERIDTANELRGNTFNMSSIGEKDTITIEFKDSTFTVFEYDDRSLPWRIASFENNNILVFDSRVIAIEQIDKNTLKGLLISEKDYEIILEKRQLQWNKELLNGIWIEEKNYDLFFNDSIVKPPLPPAPPGITESDFQYPPFYEIKGDTISASYFYQVSKSGIDISNTTEFLTLELQSDLDKVEKLWKIKKLTDSIMIIDRTIEKENKKFSILTTTEENIKLIKKR
ncbi:hypothetical protein SAMN04487906_2044 [Zhouia amylolytica]|uniref:Uncharacterized protein n=1 Tax=Zhouia amylolytica TaxID=376730 RepID=A0A1I6TPK9_9FLAO|nr:hypothetical protein [Zhouia amylolytica]SFS91081.1 hypothetical protein SAMN04487906_2044 [Zhouia amylolytica]